jgi:2-methylaconitate cis-trans-isomerase PrpF
MGTHEIESVSEFGDQVAIPCSLYRGGTSKGVFFMQNDLPKDKHKQIDILLKVMGSPDHRQIDGLGGADPLTSRIGIISKIEEPLTTVPIFDINTQMDVVAEVKIKKGKAESSGDFHIAGVPYPGSKIKLHFCRPCGLSLKPLLPTGQVRDVLEASFGNIEVSLIYCIDPVIFVHAQSVGLQGREMPEDFSKARRAASTWSSKNESYLHRLFT